MGRKEKIGRFKRMLSDNKVDFLMLQETKRSGVDERFIRSFWGSRNLEFSKVDADGLSGGMLCVWDSSVFVLEDVCAGRNFQILSGSIHNSFPCSFVNVYGPCGCADRKKVWDIIINLSNFFPKPWCMGGDFNEIRLVSERQGSSNRDRGMSEFNSFID